MVEHGGSGCTLHNTSTVLPTHTAFFFSNWRGFCHRSVLMSSRDPLWSMRRNSSSATSRTRAGGRSPHLPTSSIMVTKTSGKMKRMTTKNPNAELSDLSRPISCRGTVSPGYGCFLVFTSRPVYPAPPNAYPPIHRFNVPYTSI